MKRLNLCNNQYEGIGDDDHDDHDDHDDDDDDDGDGDDDEMVGECIQLSFVD